MMLRTSLVLLGLSILAADCSAQGLRVSTIVRNAAALDSAGREPVVASSVSLFHNGRVYDYVESAGEVVIFERAAKRFTVMNQREGVYTTIAFQELQQLLDARAPRTQEYINELNLKKSPEAARASRTLKFQLTPEFKKKFDSTSGRVTLTSPSWKYTVSTREWDSAEQVERYLAYTDWAARLNCVLFPSSMFPEPRIALNDELRKQTNRMPVVVHLDLRPDERIVRRAEHQFVRNLTDRDRSLINGWEGTLKSGALKKLPFRSYQKAILISQRR